MAKGSSNSIWYTGNSKKSAGRKKFGRSHSDRQSRITRVKSTFVSPSKGVKESARYKADSIAFTSRAIKPTLTYEQVAAKRMLESRAWVKACAKSRAWVKSRADYKARRRALNKTLFTIKQVKSTINLKKVFMPKPLGFISFVVTIKQSQMKKNHRNHKTVCLVNRKHKRRINKLSPKTRTAQQRKQHRKAIVAKRVRILERRYQVVKRHGQMCLQTLSDKQIQIQYFRLRAVKPKEARIVPQPMLRGTRQQQPKSFLEHVLQRRVLNDSASVGSVNLARIMEAQAKAASIVENSIARYGAGNLSMSMDTYSQTLDLILSGKKSAEIAEIRNLKVKTIYSHAKKLVEENRLDGTILLGNFAQQLVEAAHESSYENSINARMKKSNAAWAALEHDQAYFLISIAKIVALKSQPSVEEAEIVTEALEEVEIAQPTQEVQTKPNANATDNPNDKETMEAFAAPQFIQAFEDLGLEKIATLRNSSAANIEETTPMIAVVGMIRPNFEPCNANYPFGIEYQKSNPTHAANIELLKLGRHDEDAVLRNTFVKKNMPIRCNLAANNASGTYLNVSPLTIAATRVYARLTFQSEDPNLNGSYISQFVDGSVRNFAHNRLDTDMGCSTFGIFNSFLKGKSDMTYVAENDNVPDGVIRIRQMVKDAIYTGVVHKSLATNGNFIEVFKPLNEIFESNQAINDNYGDRHALLAVMEVSNMKEIPDGARGQYRILSDSMTLYYIPEHRLSEIIEAYADCPHKKINVFCVKGLPKAAVITPTPEVETAPHANAIVEDEFNMQEFLNETKEEINRLGWTYQEAQNYVLTTYDKSRRIDMNPEEAQEFLTYMRSIPTPLAYEEMESSATTMVAEPKSVAISPDSPIEMPVEVPSYNKELRVLYQYLSNPFPIVRGTNPYTVEEILEIFDPVASETELTKVLDWLDYIGERESFVASKNCANAVLAFLISHLVDRNSEKPVAWPVDFSAQTWTKGDVKDIVDIIHSLMSSRRGKSAEGKILGIKDVLSYEGSTEDSGIGRLVIEGKTAFTFKDGLVFDRRGRAFNHTAVVGYKTTDKEGNVIEDLNRVVSSMSNFMAFFANTYLPLMAHWSGHEGIYTTMLPNLEVCLNHGNVFKLSKDELDGQSGGALHGFKAVFVPTGCERVSFTKSRLMWPILPKGGKDLKGALDSNSVMNKLVMGNLKKHMIDAALELHARYSLSLHFTKKCFIAGYIDHVNMALVQRVAPNLYNELLAMYPRMTTQDIISFTIKATKGPKRIYLSLPQAEECEDAAMAGWMLFSMKKHVSGFKVKACVAPTLLMMAGMAAFIKGGNLPVVAPPSHVPFMRYEFNTEDPIDFSLSTMQSPDSEFHANVDDWTTEVIDGWNVVTFSHRQYVKPGVTIIGINGGEMILHEPTSEGELVSLRWCVEKLLDNQTKVLKVEYTIKTPESSVKIRSISKGQYFVSDPRLIKNSMNEALGLNIDVDIVLPQDVIKADVIYSWLMVAANTAYHGNDAKLVELVKEANKKVLGHANPSSNGKFVLCIEPTSVVLGVYNQLLEYFASQYRKTMWFNWEQAEEQAKTVYELYRNKTNHLAKPVPGTWFDLTESTLKLFPELAELDKVREANGYRWWVASESQTITDTTNVLAFMMDGDKPVYYAQRCAVLVGSPDRPLYNVEMAESSTVRQNIGPSTDMMAYIMSMTTTMGRSDEVIDEQKRILNEGVQDMVIAKMLCACEEGYGYGDTMEIKLNTVGSNVELERSKSSAMMTLVEHAKEVGLWPPASLSRFSDKFFQRLAWAARKIHFTFMVGEQKYSIWLPGLFAINKLTSQHEENRSFVSIFVYDILLPCLQRKPVSAIQLNLFVGTFTNFKNSEETVKFMNGGRNSQNKRVSLPNIPTGEYWVKISDHTNTVYQDFIRNGIPVNDLHLVAKGLIVKGSRAPMPTSATLRIRLIEEISVDTGMKDAEGNPIYEVKQRLVPFEGEEPPKDFLFYEISETQGGVSAMICVTDGGDDDGDPYYIKRLKLGLKYLSTFESIRALRNKTLGMDMFSNECSVYIADYFTAKTWEKATQTLTGLKNTIEKQCIKDAVAYIDFNMKATELQNFAVGVMYGVYVMGTHICGLIGMLKEAGLSYPTKMANVAKDWEIFSPIIAEPYEIMLGGYDSWAYLLWEYFVKPCYDDSDFVSLDTVRANMLTHKRRQLKDMSAAQVTAAMAKEEAYVNTLNVEQLQIWQLGQILKGMNANANKAESIYTVFRAIRQALRISNKGKLPLVFKKDAAGKYTNEYLPGLTDLDKIICFSLVVFEINRGRFSGYNGIIRSVENTPRGEGHRAALKVARDYINALATTNPDFIEKNMTVYAFGLLMKNLKPVILGWPHKAIDANGNEFDPHAWTQEHLEMFLSTLQERGDYVDSAIVEVVAEEAIEVEAVEVDDSELPLEIEDDEPDTDNGDDDGGIPIFPSDNGDGDGDDDGGSEDDESEDSVEEEETLTLFTDEDECVAEEATNFIPSDEEEVFIFPSEEVEYDYAEQFSEESDNEEVSLFEADEEEEMTETIEFDEAAVVVEAERPSSSTEGDFRKISFITLRPPSEVVEATMEYVQEESEKGMSKEDKVALAQRLRRLADLLDEPEQNVEEVKENEKPLTLVPEPEEEMETEILEIDDYEVEVFQGEVPIEEEDSEPINPEEETMPTGVATGVETVVEDKYKTVEDIVKDVAFINEPAAERIERMLATLNEDQAAVVLDHVNDKNVELMGEGGAGKTYVSRDVIRDILDTLHWPYTFAGSTGTSVMNCEGHGTFSSLMKLGFGFGEAEFKNCRSLSAFNTLVSRCLQSKFIKDCKALQNHSRPMTILVDEVSMLESLLLRIVYEAAKKAEVKLIWFMIGDVLQFMTIGGKMYFQNDSVLKPGAAGSEEKLSIIEAEKFEKHYLDKNVRAAGDEEFAEALKQLRCEGTMRHFKKIFDRTDEAPEDAMQLFFNNRSVKAHNRMCTEKMIAAGADYKTYTALITTSAAATTDKWYLKKVKDAGSKLADTVTIYDPIEVEMTLCVGMPVMLRRNIKNISGDIIASNGSTGTIIKLMENAVKVKFDRSGLVLEIKQEAMSVPHNKDGKPLGTFSQLCLHPFFASTFHKIQGITLDKPFVVHAYAISDEGELKEIKAYHSFYVACSRSTTSKNLFFAKRPIGNFKGITSDFMWEKLCDSHKMHPQCLAYIEKMQAAKAARLAAKS